MNKTKVKLVLDEDKQIIEEFYNELRSLYPSSQREKLQEAFNQMMKQRSDLIKKTLRIDT